MIRSSPMARNASRCILVSATPYNKAYLDLANQLRLFMNPDDVVGIRPEEYIRRDCDGRPDEFTRRHQCPVNCLSAFEKSGHADDWRELMRLFMVRRTRSFVERNYAFIECPACATVLTPTQDKCPKCERPKAKEDRRFLILEGGSRFHFAAALRVRPRRCAPHPQRRRGSDEPVRTGHARSVAG